MVNKNMFATEDVFEKGYEGSKFIISTITKKQTDGKFLCKGKIVQGRASVLDDGALTWEDESVESEALTDSYIHGNNVVLESLFKYLIKKGFYLFKDEEDESKDDIQEV